MKNYWVQRFSHFLFFRAWSHPIKTLQIKKYFIKSFDLKSSISEYGTTNRSVKLARIWVNIYIHIIFITQRPKPTPKYSYRVSTQQIKKPSALRSKHFEFRELSVFFCCSFRRRWPPLCFLFSSWGWGWSKSLASGIFSETSVFIDQNCRPDGFAISSISLQQREGWLNPSRSWDGLCVGNGNLNLNKEFVYF